MFISRCGLLFFCIIVVKIYNYDHQNCLWYVKLVGVRRRSLRSRSSLILKRFTRFLSGDSGDSGIAIFSSFRCFGTRGSLSIADLDILCLGGSLSFDKLLWILWSMNCENWMNLFIYLWAPLSKGGDSTLLLLSAIWTDTRVVWLGPPWPGTNFFLSLASY